MVGIDTSPKNVAASSPRRDDWASDNGDSARRGVREYESLGLLRNEHCRNREIARAPASMRNSFAWLVMSADLIMRSEIWAPTARAPRLPHRDTARV
jgi:hypothetical protein